MSNRVRPSLRPGKKTSTFKGDTNLGVYIYTMIFLTFLHSTQGAPPPPPPTRDDGKKEDKETRLKKLKQEMMDAAAAKDYKRAAQLQQEIQRVEKEDEEQKEEEEEQKEEEPDRLTKRIIELEKQLKEAESKFDFSACAEIQEELDRLRRPAIPATPDAVDSDEETDELRPIITSRRTQRRAKGSKRSKETFWMGSIPIWRHASFVEHFAGHNLRIVDTKIDETTSLETPWQNLENSLVLVTECLEHLLERDDHALPNLWKVHDAVKTASEMIVPALTNDVHRAHEFLVSQSRRVRRMRAGEMLLLPCGTATSSRCVPIIFAVSVEEGNRCTVAVINTSAEDLEFHPRKPTARNSSGVKYHCCLVSREVDIDRLKDACFWFFLIRQIVFTNDENDPRDLYTQILPYLAKRSANTAKNASDSENISNAIDLPVVRGDSSKLELALQAVRFACWAQGMKADQIEDAIALLKCSMIAIVNHDLNASPSLSGPECLIVETTTRSLLESVTRTTSESKSEKILSLQELERTENIVKSLKSRIEELTKLERSNAIPPPLRLDKDSGSSLRLKSFPLFGRFLFDYNTESLAGPSRVRTLFFFSFLVFGSVTSTHTYIQQHPS